MTGSVYSVADLEEQERELVLDSFTLDDAGRLGTALVERAVREQLPVVVDVRRGNWVVFRAALPGSAPDQADWIDKKSATVLRFQASSLLTGLRMAADGRDPFEGGWLDLARYTMAGGSFPVRVAGAGVVAVVTVSGLTSDEDHTLILDALRAHRARYGGPGEGGVDPTREVGGTGGCRHEHRKARRRSEPLGRVDQPAGGTGILARDAHDAEAGEGRERQPLTGADEHHGGGDGGQVGTGGVGLGRRPRHARQVRGGRPRRRASAPARAGDRSEAARWRRRR